MDELLTTIELKRANKSDEALSAVASDKGRAIMDRALTRECSIASFCR
jgi:CHASE3 domain sensor protein